MSCDRVSPLTNNTRPPGETTTVDGLTPDAPIVTVGSADPPPDGADGLLPQADVTTNASVTATGNLATNESYSRGR